MQIIPARVSLGYSLACAYGWLICFQPTAWLDSTPIPTAVTRGSTCIWVRICKGCPRRIDIFKAFPFLRLHAALLDTRPDPGLVLRPSSALQSLGQHCECSNYFGPGRGGRLPGASTEPGQVLDLAAVCFARALASPRPGSGRIQCRDTVQLRWIAVVPQQAGGL